MVKKKKAAKKKATKKKRSHGFKKGHEPAHKGRRTQATALEDLKVIKKIQRHLEKEDSLRNLALFTLSINNGCRPQDTLQLRYKQVIKAGRGGVIPIREGKTKKENVIVLNRVTWKSLKRYLNERNDWQPDDYIFRSRQGKNSPLSVQRFIQLVREWLQAVGVEDGNWTAMSLRRGFGVIQRKHFGASWEVLSKRFAHASPVTTMKYLSVTSEEVQSILLNNEIGE